MTINISTVSTRFNVVYRLRHSLRNGHEMEAVLFSVNLHRSACFYADVLGFHVRQDSGKLDIDYGDGDLQVLLTDDTDLVSGLAVIIHVSNILDLRGLFEDRAVPNLSGLAFEPHQPLRFSVTDPDSNTLFFVEKKTAAQTAMPSRLIH